MIRYKTLKEYKKAERSFIKKNVPCWSREPTMFHQQWEAWKQKLEAFRERHAPTDKRIDNGGPRPDNTRYVGDHKVALNPQTAVAILIAAGILTDYKQAVKAGFSQSAYYRAQKKVDLALSNWGA